MYWRIKTLAPRPSRSFLIDSLVWNVPDEGFGHVAYKDDVRWVLAHLFNNTIRVELQGRVRSQ